MDGGSDFKGGLGGDQVVQSCGKGGEKVGPAGDGAVLFGGRLVVQGDVVAKPLFHQRFHHAGPRAVGVYFNREA